MNLGNEIILIAGVLSVLAVFAGLLSVRFGTPLLLGLIGLGMLAGEDGPGRISFEDFQGAYVVGSLSLAVILFQGGLNIERGMIRKALWPSIALATVGVVISAAIVGAAAVALFHLFWTDGFLLGAVTAPTDAAAVSTLLRVSRIEVPSRLIAALELESGINDPMSIFLTLGSIELLTHPHSTSAAGLTVLFLKQMGGGLAIGLLSGVVLLRLFRWLRMDPSAFPVLALGFALTVFGGTELIGASGFLATYLAGVIVGNAEHPASQPVARFFDTMGWLAQNTLFLMLGLLVTPSHLRSLIVQAISIAAVLVFIARPVASFACLLPFGWSARASGFVAWAGLRGAVPIYLTIIALLEGVKTADRLFEGVFVVVVISVAVQGWTVKLVARLLGLQADELRVGASGQRNGQRASAG
jgi:cell volume regulation protein A